MTMRWALRVVALCAILMFARTARAQGSPATYGNFGTAPAIVLVMFDLPSLIGNSIYVARHTRAPAAWPVLGFVFGAGNVAMSFAFIIPNAQNGGDIGWAPWTLMAVALADIGMGVWALALPPARRRASTASHRDLTWAIVPSASSDVSGRPTYGVTFAAATF